MLLAILTVGEAAVIGTGAKAQEETNQVGELAIEQFVSNTTFSGTFASFGTIHNTLCHLSVYGRDNKKNTAFCLDAPKRFTSGTPVRCIGRVQDFDPQSADALNGIVAFYLQDTRFPSKLRQLLTQLAVWYIRKHPSNYNFSGSVFREDLKTVLSYPEFYQNNTQLIQWYIDVCKMPGTVLYYTPEEAWEGLLDETARTLGAAARGEYGQANTAVWSAGSEDYQRLLVVGRVTPFQDVGKIEVYKKSENGQALAGAVFTIYDSAGKEVGTLGPTDANGYAVTAQSLPSGSYTVVETGFPKGYTDNGTTSWKVEVQFNQTARVGGSAGVVNRPNEGTAAIRKTDEDGQALAGVLFGLYETESGEQIAQVRTGADGTAKIEGIAAGKSCFFRELQPAHEDYQKNERDYPVQIVAGQTAWANRGKPVVNEWKRGALRIYKTDGRTGQPLSGVRFGIFTDAAATKQCGEVVTDANGEAIFGMENGKFVLRCRQLLYVKELASKDATWVVSETVYPVQILGETIVDINGGAAVENYQKYWQLTVYKRDAHNGGICAGDAKVAGAVYGLYNSEDRLLEACTVDSAGCFRTKAYVAGTGYYLKELEAPAGYQKDETRHELDAYTAPLQLTKPLTEAELTLTEKAVEGQVSLIKFKESEGSQKEPEAGAEFVIYRKAEGSYETAAAGDEERVYDACTVNENGVAVWSGGETVSKKLVYGIYILHQVKGADGYRLSPDQEIRIEENGRVYPIILQNDQCRTRIVIRKRDAESGKLITASEAAFRIMNLQTGEWVTYRTEYPEPSEVQEFATKDGVLTIPVSLPVGRYRLEEVKVPEGYSRVAEEMEFEVGAASGETMEVNVDNAPQKGRLIVEKQGTVFSAVEEQNSLFGRLCRPVFEEGTLAGCVFRITARAEIRTGDGTCHFYPGDLVEEIRTDENGRAVSGDLYPGEYLLTETAAPDGYQLAEPQVFTIRAETGKARAEEKRLTVTNERMETEVSLKKKVQTWKAEIDGETIGRYLTEMPGSGAVFGIYSAQEFEAASGQRIAPDQLMGIMETGADGLAVFRGALPLGAYYVQELRAPGEEYLLTEQRYAFSLSSEHSRVQLQNGSALLNEIKKFPVEPRKIEKDSQNPLADALLEIRDAEGTVLYRGLTAEDGGLKEVYLSPGQYTLQEAAAPDGYARNPSVLEFVVEEDGSIRGEIVLEDEEACLFLTKVNEKGEALSGASFVLRREDGEWIGPVTVNEKGEACFRGLKQGNYWLKEIRSPEGYVRSETEIALQIDDQWQNEAEEAHLVLVNEKTVQTGDRAAWMLWGAAAAVALAGAVLLGRKKRRSA